MIFLGEFGAAEGLGSACRGDSGSVEEPVVNIEEAMVSREDAAVGLVAVLQL